MAICKKCGKEYNSTLENYHYCSLGCKRAARKEKQGIKTEKRKCIICKESFYPVSANEKTCSPACKLVNQRNVAQRNARKHKPRSCKECGLVFVPGSASGLFCSVKCRESYSKKNTVKGTREAIQSVDFGKLTWINQGNKRLTQEEKMKASYIMLENLVKRYEECEITGDEERRIAVRTMIKDYLTNQKRQKTSLI